MVRDALRGPRLVGVVLLRGQWRRDDQGTPPVFGCGGAGEIVRFEELPDGRFDIVLRGIGEFRIVRELRRAAYREAVVEWASPACGELPGATRARVWALVQDYMQRRSAATAFAGALAPTVDDELFVNFLAQHLDLPAIGGKRCSRRGRSPSGASAWSTSWSSGAKPCAPAR
jgi:Lon protease-like protein